ncbi:hypothetical protein CHS0354_027788 [Potamilus streckersoni]|uniref:Uncharacterized protein n=1 Tax=Potamilus streckersoni TaxID=2493646 RepID=A0AAE0SBA0_9BIVA|nr:hypothetical protein CHS0354_027788 [Potamilus streckersoni]
MGVICILPLRQGLETDHSYLFKDQIPLTFSNKSPLNDYFTKYEWTKALHNKTQTAPEEDDLGYIFYKNLPPNLIRSQIKIDYVIIDNSLSVLQALQKGTSRTRPR